MTTIVLMILLQMLIPVFSRPQIFFPKATVEENDEMNEDPSFLSANEVDDDYRQYYPPHMSEAREWRVRIFTMPPSSPSLPTPSPPSSEEEEDDDSDEIRTTIFNVPRLCKGALDKNGNCRKSTKRYNG